jgi:hypothetical protein
MSLIDDLGTNPKAFLRKYPITVHADCNALFEKGVRRFTLKRGDGNAVLLLPHNKGGGRAIKAHWLPWKNKSYSCMNISSKETSIFFTSEMSGCRLSVARISDEEFKVAHLAGNMPRQAFDRDQAEKKEIFTEAGQRGLVRRLTFDQSRGGYGPNWAFVVGHYHGQGWKFHAQINKGHEQQTMEFVKLLRIE